MEKAKELSTTVGLQQVTMLEVLETRHARDVVPGVGRIYAKMKAYGIPIHRIHSDCERCFITDSFRDFYLNRSLYQTMTAGDTPQENGRVESEICQIKRRLRLMLAESKLPKANWPNVARWVGEQRFRSQIGPLGIPTKPMIPPGTKVMVKQKLWNKKMGALSNPYKRTTLLGPSPLMSSGWVVKDGHKVQHARAVVQESPHSEAARMELEETLPRRLVGKQHPIPAQERLQPPKLTDQDETDLENFVPAAEVPEIECDPESPLPDEEAVDGQPDQPELPALHALQAGGECYLECEKCGLMQPGSEKCCGFCFSGLRMPGVAAMSSSLSSSSGLAAAASSSLSSSSGLAAAASGSSSSRSGLAPPCTLSWSSGLAVASESMSSRSGSAGAHRSLNQGTQLVEDQEEEEVGVDIQDPGELIEQIRHEHWGWKQQWNQELARTVVGSEVAAIHGGYLEYLENVLLDLEEELEIYDNRPGGEREQLKMLQADLEQPSATAHPVLQTLWYYQR